MPPARCHEDALILALRFYNKCKAVYRPLWTRKPERLELDRPDRSTSDRTPGGPVSFFLARPAGAALALGSILEGGAGMGPEMNRGSGGAMDENDALTLLPQLPLLWMPPLQLRLSPEFHFRQ